MLAGACEALAHSMSDILEERNQKKNPCTSYMLTDFALRPDSMLCFSEVHRQKVFTSSFPRKLASFFTLLTQLAQLPSEVGAKDRPHKAECQKMQPKTATTTLNSAGVKRVINHHGNQ